MAAARKSLPSGVTTMLPDGLLHWFDSTKPLLVGRDEKEMVRVISRQYSSTRDYPTMQHSEDIYDATSEARNRRGNYLANFFVVIR